MKCPGSAHLFLTAPGKYGPWMGPEFDLVGVQVSRSYGFWRLSGYAAIGWVKTHRQSQMYMSFGQSGKFGEVFDYDNIMAPVKLFKLGAGVNVFAGDYTRKGRVDIDAFNGWTRSFNGYAPFGSVGFGSSATYNPNSGNINPTDGFNTVGFGLAEGWGAGYDYSYTYFNIPGTDIQLPNTNNPRE